MKANKLTLFSMLIWSLTTATVCAEDDYTPAEYQPKDSYSEQYAGAATSVIQKAAAANIQKSATGGKPVTMPEASDAAPQNQQSPMVVEAIVLIIGLLAAVAFRIRSKLPPIQLSTRVANTEASAVRRTAVERYIENLAVRKTGVEKYLEKQAEFTPPTSVAKYLAKQIVKNTR